MICVIRIRGDVSLDSDVRSTFERLRLRRKYSCIVLNPNKEQAGMISKIKSMVAYGEISPETFEKLIDSRGQKVDKSKKIESKKAIEGISKGKEYEEFNLKPFFRLHPPRGGLKSSKLHFPKGVLGNHGEKINDLLGRMM